GSRRPRRGRVILASAMRPISTYRGRSVQAPHQSSRRAASLAKMRESATDAQRSHQSWRAQPKPSSPAWQQRGLLGVRENAKLVGTGGVPHPLEGLRLDLPDALAGDPELLAHLFQRPLVAVS